MSYVAIDIAFCRYVYGLYEIINELIAYFIIMRKGNIKRGKRKGGFRLGHCSLSPTGERSIMWSSNKSVRIIIMVQRNNSVILWNIFKSRAIFRSIFLLFFALNAVAFDVKLCLEKETQH